MRIGDVAEKTMMVRFRIDGGKFKSSYNSFSVGFPDKNKSVPEIIKEVRSENDAFYQTLKFSREEKNKALFAGLKLTYPIIHEAGKFNLNCWFGNGPHCRYIVVLSQTPDAEEDSLGSTRL